MGAYFKFVCVCAGFRNSTKKNKPATAALKHHKTNMAQNHKMLVTVVRFVVSLSLSFCFGCIPSLFLCVYFFLSLIVEIETGGESEMEDEYEAMGVRRDTFGEISVLLQFY